MLLLFVAQSETGGCEKKEVLGFGSHVVVVSLLEVFRIELSSRLFWFQFTRTHSRQEGRQLGQTARNVTLLYAEACFSFIINSKPQTPPNPRRLTTAHDPSHVVFCRLGICTILELDQT